MKRLLLVLLLLAVLGVAGVSIDASSPSIPLQGAAEITRFIRETISRGDAPGVVVAVTNREQIVYEGAAGKSSVVRNTPMAADTIFNIASMTKAVTSVAVMQLVEQGKLQLDDPIGKYLPKFSNPLVLTKFNPVDASYETRPAKRAITIRHLLTHTSGLGYTFSNQTLNAIQQKTKKADYDLPLLFDPGEGWAYGPSTRVLGDLIAAITRQPLDQYLQSKVLGPLNMNDTTYLPPPEKYSRVVAVNARDATGKFVERPAGPIQINVAGDGGLYSTAADYATFLRMLLNGGRLGQARILDAKTVNTMLQPQTGNVAVQMQKSSNPLLSKDFPLGAGEDRWGLGFQLAKRQQGNRRSPGSGTWAGIFNTHYFIDPTRQVAVVVMMQTLPFYDDAAMRLYGGVEEAVYRNLK
jgi:CubicO group peptidase (beta-lactamase class C family)